MLHVGFGRDYAANHDIFMRQGRALQVRLDIAPVLWGGTSVNADWPRAPSPPLFTFPLVRPLRTTQAQFRENASIVDERQKVVRFPSYPISYARVLFLVSPLFVVNTLLQASLSGVYVTDHASGRRGYA